MRLTLALCTATAAAAIAAGCGSDEDVAAGVDPNDDRAVTLDCLKREQKLPARLIGRDGILVAGATTGPRIQFFLTAGQAEAAQFEGRYEGTEQISKALLFVRNAPDEQLEKVEACLDEL